jgi:hypothetical protein
MGNVKRKSGSITLRSCKKSPDCYYEGSKKNRILETLKTAKLLIKS